jgi:transposase, IS5 family
MALRETQISSEADLFPQELVNLVNLRHPLVQLAGKIDCKCCEKRFGSLYKADMGRPGPPIGLMLGLQLLKHISNVSDEEVVAAWLENPYWQHFCGEQYRRHDWPIDPGLMTGFRKRIGEAGCEVILGLSVNAGLATGTLAKASLAVVNVDTTVQDQGCGFSHRRAPAAQGARGVGAASEEDRHSIGAKATNASVKQRSCAPSATPTHAR